MLSLGEVCAILAPLAWSVAVILFRKASTLPPETMNFFKNSVALVMLGLTMLALGVPLPSDRSLLDWLWVAVSGLMGLAFADTLLFSGLSRIGAARLAVMDTFYAPTVILVSYLLLGERLGGWFWVGASAVLGGVALASIEKGALSGKLGPELRLGMFYAWVAVSSTATGVVIVKPVLEESNLIEVTWSRLFFGVLGQGLWLAFRGQLPGTLRSMATPSVWKTMLPATIVGTWLSLLLWLGGFKWAPASEAAVLNQLATVYILVLARIFLKEEVRLRQAAGAMVAAGGALLIVLTIQR